MRIEIPGRRAEPEYIATQHGSIIIPDRLHHPLRLDIDSGSISRLINHARESALSAYAPYSNFRVGAALTMADDDQQSVFHGANTENASYGLSHCAERNALYAAVGRGFRMLRCIAVATIDSSCAPLSGRSPCGACRQALREFANPSAPLTTIIVIDHGDPEILCELTTIDHLLPFGFALGLTK